MFWKSFPESVNHQGFESSVLGFFKLDACVVFNDVHYLSENIIELKERERYSEGFEIT